MGAQRRVLDDASRQRRARKALENLEQDNNCDDPHADLVMSKKALSLFQEEEEHGQRKTKRKARTLEYYKQRFRKNLAQLLEEEAGEQDGEVPYLAVQLPESKIPPRRLCAVCGFPRLQMVQLMQYLFWPSQPSCSSYSCSTCGARYCSLRCLE